MCWWVRSLDMFYLLDIVCRFGMKAESKLFGRQDLVSDSCLLVQYSLVYFWERISSLDHGCALQIRINYDKENTS